MKLPEDFSKDTYDSLELRGKEALHAYVRFASWAIVESAFATGWKAHGCYTRADVFRSALLHVFGEFTTPKRFLLYKLYNICSALHRQLLSVVKLLISLVYIRD